MPEAPDPANKKLLPDENTWVYEEYNRLRQKIAETVDPLVQYLETFQVFTEEYKLDPEKLITELDDQKFPRCQSTLEGCQLPQKGSNPSKRGYSRN